MIENNMADASLRNSEPMSDIKEILDSITDGFLAIDLEWRIIHINRAAMEILDVVQIMGQKVWNQFPKDNTFKKKVTACLSEQKTVYFESYSKVTKRWLEVSAYPSTTGIYIYLRDITERKNIEQMFKVERERLYTILDGLPGLVYMQEANYGIYYANRHFREVFGDSNGKKCYELTKGICKPCEECTTEKLFQEGFPKSSVSQRLYNGKLYELHEQALEDFDGRRFVVKILVDITEKIKAEQEIARLDRLNLVGEMAATIAHEVRNPMTTVRGFLQMLGTKAELETYKEFFEIMINELDRANYIISDFLSLARNKKDDFKIQNLNKIIDALYPLISVDAISQDKNIDLQLSDIPNIALNEVEIRQVILNLTRNALEAMNDGGTVYLKTYQENDEVVLSVQDQGNGIDKKILDNLGTPFLTTKEQGTGLGLAVTFAIVERHNAKIKIETDSNGTKFLIRFKMRKL